MFADLDFDVILNLGSLQNVNLCLRGVYCIKVSLFYGESKISPVGMFSAPSTLDAFVGTQRLPTAPITNKCDINTDDSDDLAFSCRSFVIRYRGELHELNDAVHWRLTVPKVDLNEFYKSNQSAYCKDLLRLEYELLCCELEHNAANARCDMYTQVEKFIPKVLNYKLVATQSICLQRVRTGLHEYFPIRFQRNFTTNLDTFVHCALTGIRYSDMMLPRISEFPCCNEETKSVAAESVSLWYGGDTELDLATLQSNYFNEIGEIKVEFGNANVQATKRTNYLTTTIIDPVGTFSNDNKLTSFAASIFAKIPATSKAKDNERVIRRTNTGNDSVCYIEDVKFENHSEKPDTTRNNDSKSANPHSVSSNVKKKFSKVVDVVSVGVAPVSGLLSNKNVSSGMNPDATTEDTAANEDEGDVVDSAGVGVVDIIDRVYAVESSLHCSYSSNPKKFWRDRAKCGLARSQLEHLYTRLSSIYIRNYEELYNAVNTILQWDHNHKLGMKRSTEKYIELDISHPPLDIVCNKDTIIDEMMECDSYYTLQILLKDKFNECNVLFNNKWSRLVSTLPRMLTMLKEKLLANFQYKMRLFWKRQVLLHICSTNAIAKPVPFIPEAPVNATIESAHELEIKSPESHAMSSNYGHISTYNRSVFNNYIRFERDFLLCGGKTGMKVDDKRENVGYVARGLNIFDGIHHSDITKLPVLIMEQYDASSNTKLYVTSRGGLYPNRQDLYPEDADMNASGVNILDNFYNSYKVYIKQFPVLNGSLELNSQYLRYPFTNYPVSINTTLHELIQKDVNIKSCSLLEKILLPCTSLTVPSVSDHSESKRSSHVNADVKTHVPVITSCFAKYENSSPSHLVVMQHGYMGHYCDMWLLRDIIATSFPDNIKILVAESNSGEPKSGESIDKMGVRLANEIEEFCRSYIPSVLCTTCASSPRVSFIGHSAGGLIIRRCLEEPSMRPLLSKLHVYMSLATPHMGTLFAESQLVATGMWAMLKYGKSQLLRELRLEDGARGYLGGVKNNDIENSNIAIEDSLIYRLSTNDVLQYFKKVILVSSPLDQYVPIYSARIQKSDKAENTPKIGSVIVKMAANLMSQVEPDRLIRISIEDNVTFRAGAANERLVNGSAGPTVMSSVDSIIGRTAHICYLENPIVVEALMMNLYPYFR